MTGSRAWRRALAIGALVVALVVPYLVRNEPVYARWIIAMSFLTLWVRLVDLAREKRPVPAVRRWMHAMLIVELRRTPRVPPSLQLGALVRLVGLGSLTAGAFAILWCVLPSEALANRVVRYSAVIVASYTTLDAFAAFCILLWRGLGFAIPPMSNDPIKSRTVSEFWSQRWNLAVGGWLRDHCFMPLARRRHPNLGIVAAFAASTLLHVYLAWAGLDLRAGLTWGVFFVLQIPIVFAERALRVAAWRPVLGRIWTIGVLLLASPFFVEPVLRGVEALR